jgi:DNA-binding LacI/PurR family transcriptional regulator
VNQSPTRNTVKVVKSIRQSINRQKYAHGEFLPPLRELSVEYHVSPETVRRGLKILEKEGMIESEPRQGFRVIFSSRADTGTSPFAFVTNSQDIQLHVSKIISDAAAAEASAQGLSMLKTFTGNQENSVIAEQLENSRVWGVILDTLDPDLLKRIQNINLPVVMVNAWIEQEEVDTVIQDNYKGGFCAAQWLAEHVSGPISWVGPVTGYCHSRERYAGAVAGLAVSGRKIDETMLIDTEYGSSEKKIRDMLESSSVEGILVLSLTALKMLKAVSDDLGITLGKDIKIVWWAVEEVYNAECNALFDQSSVPPAIIWNARSMADSALTLLEDRHSGWKGEPVRICVPARLKFK